MENFERFGFDTEEEFTAECITLLDEFDQINIKSGGISTKISDESFIFIKTHKNPDLAFFAFFAWARADGVTYLKLLEKE